MDSRDDKNERIRQLTEQSRQQAAQLQLQAARIQHLEGELERLTQLLAGKAAANVVVIDSVRQKPTANVPNVEALLPPRELQFEVASVNAEDSVSLWLSSW